MLVVESFLRGVFDHLSTTTSVVCCKREVDIKTMFVFCQSKSWCWNCFCQMFVNTFALYLSIPLPYIWQYLCLTFKRLLSNVWKDFFLTFDNTFIQRLTILLSNVWQYFYPTFDNTFIQRLIILLSAVWKTLKISFALKMVMLPTIFIVWSKHGRKYRSNRHRPQLKMLNCSALSFMCGRVVEYFWKLKKIYALMVSLRVALLSERGTGIWE